ncbi:plasmid mobilization protein [Wukongibacter baidiensis]
MKERNKTLQMRITEDEFERINEKADMLGISTTNYIRMVCLNASFETQILHKDFDKEVKRKRDKLLQSRVTEEELEKVKITCKLLGLSTSEYIRMACLHSTIKICISM